MWFSYLLLVLSVFLTTNQAQSVQDALKPRTMVRLFNVSQFAWIDAKYGDVETDNEFIYQNRLYQKQVSGDIKAKLTVDVAKLKETGSAWQPGKARRPVLKDIVYLPKSMHQPKGHWRVVDRVPLILGTMLNLNIFFIYIYPSSLEMRHFDGPNVVAD